MWYKLLSDKDIDEMDKSVVLLLVSLTLVKVLSY